MNTVIESFTLDLHEIQSFQKLKVTSGDTARTLRITLTKGGITHKLADGSMAVLSAKKSNGKYLFNKCRIDSDDTTSYIVYEFTKATTDTPGIMECEILIADPTEKTIITPRFMMMVDVEINGDETFSESEKQFYTAAVEEESVRVENEKARIANEEARQNRESSMAEELEGAKHRIANLEAAATGNLYETIEESKVAHTRQLGEVLPYGILSQIDGETKRIEIGLPYQLSGAGAYRNYGKCIIKEDSVIMCKDSTYGIEIPCVLPKGAKVTVTADGWNSDTDRIFRYSFRKHPTNGAADTSASSECYIEGVALCELTDASTHLYISKYSATKPLDTDLEIRNIKVMVENPDEATLYDAHTIGIPSEFTPLDIPLKPSCLMRFFGDNNSEHTASYTFSYKQKIGG